MIHKKLNEQKPIKKVIAKRVNFIVYIVWDDGKKEKEYFDTYENAMTCASGLKMAFGKQIWVAVDRCYS